MKKPREILFARHRAIEPKLDAVRNSVVTAVCDRRDETESKRRSQTVTTSIWLTLWRELFLPSRRIWAGLAAVWIGIFAVNFSQRDPSPVMAAKSSSPQMMLTFRQQERLLAELTGPGEPFVAEPPKNKTTAPRPRSERDFEIFTT